MVALVDHDFDAGLRGQKREVVLLLSPEDQADPCGGLGSGQAGGSTLPVPSPRLTFTVGDAWVLRGPHAIEGVAAAVGGVVERLEMPGTKVHAQISTRLRPVTHCVWPEGPQPALSLQGAVCGWRDPMGGTHAHWVGPRGVATALPPSPGLAVLAIVAAGEDKVAAVVLVAVLTRGQHGQDVHVVEAVPRAYSRHA